MSWLWSTSPIDELVDRATSENLPAGAEDLALNLEICDQIRSKQVTPKDAVKALKRRIGHKNPNVQLLALGLTDVCAKNGGHHFLVEVASREFVDNMISILKAPSGCNLEVKNRILGLIQTWGILFRGKQGLGYVCDTYMILQHEGFQFPPKDNIGAALVESEAPPDWTDSDVCTRCRSAFTLTNRKHHCRACGSTFCGQCSSKTMALPNLGVAQEVRVCDGCWMKKKLGNKSVVALESHGLGGGLEFVPSGGVGGSSNNKSATALTPSSNGAKTTTTTNALSKNNASKSTAEAEDADLLKAIELSLKEANNQPGYSAPKRSSSVPAKKAPAPVAAVEEEDADLLAAIEASLRETTIHQSFGTSSSAQRSSSQRQSTYSSYTFTKKPVTATVSQNELTDTEKSNVEMFSVLVDRIQMMQGDVAGNREVQALYEQISKLQLKVALSIEEASRKQQEFVTFNEKIDHAVRIYDHLLQERLNSSYQRRMNANNYGHPGQGQYINNIPQTPQTPQQGHVYPQTGNAPDSRYAQYVPSVGTAPYGGVPPTQQPQTPQIPFQAPYQPQQPQPQQQQPQQSPYQYQPSSAPGPAPYTVTSPGSVAQDQQQQQPQGFAPAAPTQGQYGYQAQQQNFAPQQPIQQQPVQQQQPNGVAPSVMSPIPVNGQVQGQPSVLNNTYQPAMQSPLPSQPQPQQQQQQQISSVLGPAVQQAPYVFDPQQQQQQQQPIQQQPIQQQPIQQQPIQQQPIQQQQFLGGQQQYAPHQQQQPIQQQQQQQQQAFIAQPPPQPIAEEAPLIEF